MISIPRMLLIGAATKNAGKTTLSCRIIEQFREHAIVALKATIHRDDIRGQWSVTREYGAHPEKDTGRLLAAGAEAVWWLRCDEDCVTRVIAELLAQVPEEAPLLCESNTLRRFVAPGLFLMVQREDDETVKPSAQAVWDSADRLIRLRFIAGSVVFDPDIVPLLRFEKETWSIES